MSTPLRSLEELRAELDEIDRELQALIERRGALAGEIAAVKNRDSIDKVRPGREAQILRRLVERHRGQFPAGSVLRIWREMVASITRMEMPEYAIAVYAAGEDQGYWDLARDHFGSRTPMTAHATAREVVAQVFDGSATIGVLPRPTEDAPGSWWTNLCVPRAPRIVYRLPFYGRGNARGGGGDAPEALAIGRVASEETGDDQTILVLETAEDVSRTAMTGMLNEASLTPTLLAGSAEGTRLYYAETEGFVASDDARLKILGARDAVGRVTVIGAYATPMGDPDTASGADTVLHAAEGE